MISVRSRHQPSSGSKEWLFLILVLIVLSSCGVSAPRTSDRVVLKPAPERTDVEEEKTTGDETVEEIIEEEEVISSFFDKPNVLNVLILAPFSDSRQAERFVEFYQGFKQATQSDDLIGEYSLQVETLNCNHNANSLFIESKVEEADIVIGPYYPDDIKFISRLLENKNKILLSPWTPGQNQNKGEHYIQLSPSLNQRIEAMTTHALRSFLPSKILLVGHSSDKGLFDQINDTLVSTYGYGSKLESFEIEDVNDREIIKELNSVIQENEIEAIIVPHWRKPSFLMTLMGRLNVLSNQKIVEEGKKDSFEENLLEKDPVKVYCLGQLLRAKKLDYSTLENLDLIITSTKGNYFDNEKSHAFRRTYFANNYISPEAEAYLGHDTYVLINQLMKDLMIGKPLEKEIICDRCFNKVVISKRNDHKLEMDAKTIQINAENINVELLKFEGYKFQPIEEY